MLEEKLQLAAIAHARHAHADYDELLETMEKEDAREKIRHEIRARLREWEGLE